MVAGKGGRKPRSTVLVYEGRRYTWSSKGYWRCTSANDRHNLARRIWEQAHGTIPAGRKITYLDGDRFNVRLENLACLSNSECQKRRLQDPDYKILATCFVTYGRLINAIEMKLDPEKGRERGAKCWETRRRHFGPSGGNGRRRAEVEA